MQIRVKKSRRQTSRIVLNLASMIDVIFLLLIYFMVTMVIATPEDKLSSTLHAESESASGARSDFQPQVIEVTMLDGQPAYRLGSRVFRDRDSLRAALDPLNKVTGLFIKVQNEPSVGFVVAAFQAGHDAGFSTVTYVVPN